jgi:hypothetical protein
VSDTPACVRPTAAPNRAAAMPTTSPPSRRCGATDPAVCCDADAPATGRHHARTLGTSSCRTIKLTGPAATPAATTRTRKH